MIPLSHKDSFVFYQKPHSNEIFFIKGVWEKIDLSTTKLLNGFIISNANKTTTYFLKGSPTLLTSDYSLQLNNKFFLQTELSKKDYLIKAQKFKVACKSNLKKVILSRTKQQIREKDKELFKLYLKLCQTYNHSFNYLLNIPDIGTWMGATPELLIEGGNGHFSTVSLAGSKPSDSSKWRKKEQEEQQLVTDYITKKLIPITSLLRYNKIPKTILAGNIAHLKTIFTFKTEKTPLEMANLLHPTPAVCGLPQKKAQDFITENEGYNREFYTGFLGEVEADSCNIFVNLRCLRIFDYFFQLYIGGGITVDSIPEKEWEETELKAKTLLDILNPT